LKTQLAFLAACVLSCLLPATAPVAAPPKNDGLENVSVLGLKTVQAALSWDEPAAPVSEQIQF
jgi:hypothetical protein